MDAGNKDEWRTGIADFWGAYFAYFKCHLFRILICFIDLPNTVRLISSDFMSDKIFL